MNIETFQKELEDPIIEGFIFQNKETTTQGKLTFRLSTRNHQVITLLEHFKTSYPQANFDTEIHTQYLIYLIKYNFTPTELMKLKDEIALAWNNKLLWWVKDNNFTVPFNKNDNVAKLLEYLTDKYSTIQFNRAAYNKNIIEYTPHDRIT